ncbi:hypothetical protein WHI96_19205 [Pseudonocardia tropica]|uniref:Lipoprotein n=1 Tax=Pseudonocardia tropica TaxID=681289 RepID=A0ABV1JY94_9PSEU
MGRGRFAVAAVVAAVFATSACAAASGAERATTPEPAAASVSASFAPATGVLPRAEAGSPVPGAAVDGAIVAARRAVDRAEARAAEARAAEESRASASGDDCAARAMAAGRFDPSCSAYQGYLDPGTSAGRAPTSGETQMQYLCERGLVPRSDC